MRLVFVMCLLIACFIEGGYCNFFTEIPIKISNALKNTWTSIVDAIQRPVRMKRLGPASRKQGHKAMSTPAPIVWSPNKSDKGIEDLTRKAAAEPKYSLPVEVNPQYMTLEEFLQKQKELKLTPTARKSSAFSSWNIMKTQFRSGKVLLPVLNTPRSSYNHRWPVLEPKRPVKTERRIYVKREESYHIPSEKNHYLAHLMDIGQKPIQPNSFKNVIQQFGKAFVQMPPL